MVTLSDVAARAGLSPMTASRVFNGQGRVSEESRERVLAAADDLGYVPNAVARSLKSARSNIVALLVSDIGNAFFAEIAKHTERALSRAGYRVMIASSDEDPALERELIQGVSQMRADGMIVVPTPENREALVRSARSGTPIVQLDRAVDGLVAPAILLDNAPAAALAVHHLAGRGYRDVVMISGPQTLTTGRERAAGAIQAAQRHPELRLEVIEAGSFMHEPSVDVVRRALEKRPDAIIAGNNIVLEACVDAFARDSISAADDVGLLGFDDMPWMSWVAPSITTVRQPLETMATTAVRTLLAQISGPGSAEVLRLPGELIARDSTAHGHREAAHDA